MARKRKANKPAASSSLAAGRAARNAAPSAPSERLCNLPLDVLLHFLAPLLSIADYLALRAVHPILASRLPVLPPRPRSGCNGGDGIERPERVAWARAAVGLLTARVRQATPAAPFVATGKECLPDISTIGFVGSKDGGTASFPLPLSGTNAATIESAGLMKMAHFGRGQQTLRDAKVRNALVCDANDVCVGGSQDADAAFRAAVEDMMPLVSARLYGNAEVNMRLRAVPYQLVLYSQGGHFNQLHRDSQKADGMVATMVVVLPSQYAGGELIVHNTADEPVTLLASPKSAEPLIGAFFASQPHKVRPVTSGVRLAYFFSLCIDGPSTKARVDPLPRDDLAMVAVRNALMSWGEMTPAVVDDMWAGDDDPENPLILIPLDHECQNNVTGDGARIFDKLKGADRVLAMQVQAIARECGLAVGLCHAQVNVPDGDDIDYFGSDFDDFDDEDDSDMDDHDEPDFADPNFDWTSYSAWEKLLQAKEDKHVAKRMLVTANFDEAAFSIEGVLLDDLSVKLSDEAEESQWPVGRDVICVPAKAGFGGPSIAREWANDFEVEELQFSPTCLVLYPPWKVCTPWWSRSTTYVAGIDRSRGIDAVVASAREPACSGCAPAMIDYGVCLETGLGTGKNVALAILLYKMALTTCVSSTPSPEAVPAVLNLARLAATEQWPGGRSPKLAVALLNKVMATNAHACLQLGVHTELGDGTHKSLEEAKRLYRRALELDPELELARDNLARL